jgi:hypothetical protein
MRSARCKSRPGGSGLWRARQSSAHCYAQSCAAAIGFLPHLRPLAKSRRASVVAGPPLPLRNCAQAVRCPIVRITPSSSPAIDWSDSARSGPTRAAGRAGRRPRRSKAVLLGKLGEGNRCAGHRATSLLRFVAAVAMTTGFQRSMQSCTVRDFLVANHTPTCGRRARFVVWPHRGCHTTVR